jgi:hypothetical protein
MDRNTCFQPFSKEELKMFLLAELHKISNISQEDITKQISRQIFSGNVFDHPCLPNKKVLSKGCFYSRYCEYIMAHFREAITGGALFEFAVLRTLQSYFGNEIDYQTQYPIKFENIPGKEGKSTKIDIALLEKKNPIALIEVKREKDTTIQDLFSPEKTGYIDCLSKSRPNVKVAVVVFASYLSKTNDFPANLFICHVCKVQDGEAYRLKENICKGDKAFLFKNVDRYHDNFIEKLIDFIDIH